MNGGNGLAVVHVYVTAAVRESARSFDLRSRTAHIPVLSIVISESTVRRCMLRRRRHHRSFVLTRFPGCEVKEESGGQRKATALIHRFSGILTAAPLEIFKALTSADANLNNSAVNAET